MWMGSHKIDKLYYDNHAYCLYTHNGDGSF